MSHTVGLRRTTFIDLKKEVSEVWIMHHKKQGKKRYGKEDIYHKHKGGQNRKEITESQTK